MHNYIYNMYIHPHKQNKSTKLSTHLVQKTSLPATLTTSSSAGHVRRLSSVRRILSIYWRSPKWRGWLNLDLVGGWPTPLKNMKVNGKDDIPYIMENKKCLKPPTSDDRIPWPMRGNWWQGDLPTSEYAHSALALCCCTCPLVLEVLSLENCSVVSTPHERLSAHCAQSCLPFLARNSSPNNAIGSKYVWWGNQWQYGNTRISWLGVQQCNPGNLQQYWPLL